MKFMKFMFVVSLVIGIGVLVKFHPVTTLVSLGAVLGLIILALLTRVIKVTEIKEGTGAAFKLLGRYCCSIMSLKGFHFGPREFIEEGAGQPSSTDDCWCIWRIRGWVFYIRWLVTIAKYTDQNNPDGFGEGYRVFLNQIQRDFTLEKAETGKGEEIPLNFKAAFKMRVANIYLFLFIAPKDVIAKVIEIIEAIVRAWIKAHSYEEIQGVSSNGGKMWAQFGEEIQGFISKISEDWGVEILKESIAIMDVGLTSEDQEAFAAKKRQRLRTAAGAQEILGGMLENEAMSMGLDDGSEAQKKLASTPEGSQKLATMVAKANQVVAQRALGVKPNLFGNADGSPLDPLMGALASLITLTRGPGSDKSGGDSGGGRQPDRGGGHGGDRGGGAEDPAAKDKRIAGETFARTGGYPSWWDPDKQKRK